MTVVKPQTPTKPNLIDTISAGYAALNRRLWIVLIPIALNIALAFGTQLSLTPLVQGARNQLDALLSVAVQDDAAGVQPIDMRAQLDTLEAQMRSSDPRQMLLWMNFVPLFCHRC